MTALNSPISMQSPTPRRGEPVDDFLDRLNHPTPAQSTGPVVAAFQCLISFGLLPLLLWPARWSEFLDTERQDLLDLIGWWRRRVSPTDARKLDRITRGLRPRPILMVLPWLAVGFNLVLMAMLYSQGDSINRLWDLTFKNVAHSHAMLVRVNPHWHDSTFDAWDPPGNVRLFATTPNADASALESHLYSVWIISLCIAYACQWRAVRLHAAAVQSLVRWTNKLGRDNRFMQIKNDVYRIGLSPVWIVLAVALCANHAWWAIPMVLAGAMQRRYLQTSSPKLRIALASQARDAFAIVQSSGDRFCPAGHCGARLPAPAKYCPRCGTAV